MAHLSYSFCMSMLHSLWQAGLLALAFFILDKSFSTKTSPLQKRNSLFILLTAQLAFFIVTFFIYYLNIENTVTESLLGNTVTEALQVSAVRVVTPWLFCIYVAAISYKMMKAIYEWLLFKKSFRTGLQKPSIDLKVFTLLKADHFGIKRKVQLWLSHTINAPLTFGFFKPVIVLPVALVNQLSMQQAETLILHELSHIKANDYLLNWILIFIENIFFYNPFVTALCKKIRLEREKYCDSNVIAFNYAPLLYAETLLKAQQVRQFQPQYQLAAVNGKKQLLRRIQFFTNKKNFTYTNNNRIVFPIVSLLFLLMFAVTCFFQYQVTATVQAPTASINAPEENAVAVNTEENALIETVSFIKNISTNLTDENLKKIEAAVEKQKPVIEKQIKNLEPLIKSFQQKAEALAQQFDDNTKFKAIPAALKENIPTKQVVVKEEQSGSKNAVVKVYTLAFIDNEWRIIPEWMLAAKEIPVDSTLPPVADSVSVEGNDQHQ